MAARPWRSKTVLSALHTKPFVEVDERHSRRSAPKNEAFRFPLIDVSGGAGINSGGGKSASTMGRPILVWLRGCFACGCDVLQQAEDFSWGRAGLHARMSHVFGNFSSRNVTVRCAAGCHSSVDSSEPLRKRFKAMRGCRRRLEMDKRRKSLSPLM